MTLACPHSHLRLGELEKASMRANPVEAQVVPMYPALVLDYVQLEAQTFKIAVHSNDCFATHIVHVSNPFQSTKAQDGVKYEWRSSFKHIALPTIQTIYHATKRKTKPGYLLD